MVSGRHGAFEKQPVFLCRQTGSGPASRRRACCQGHLVAINQQTALTRFDHSLSGFAQDEQLSRRPINRNLRAQLQLQRRGAGWHGAGPIRSQSLLGPFKLQSVQCPVGFLDNDFPAQCVSGLRQAANGLLLRQREHHCLVRRERNLQRVAKPRSAGIKPRLGIKAYHRKVLRMPFDTEGFIQPQRHLLWHNPGVAEGHQSLLSFPMCITVRLARHHFIV